ncbi:SWIM zinc finger family protein [Halomonas sp. YLGW01]|uniref:SWIM zinc finger family protein n=1 Tax=Halomonas sp. YLGW01 TaxID=2773308 RepID=UPI0017849E4D|nr:SWIM zinc finger family protein [Halomonas sp. YLGW01]
MSDCSCPVGVDCKHAVALIQTFLDQFGQGTETSQTRQSQSQVAPSGKDEVETLKQQWNRWIDQWEQPPAVLPESQYVSAEYRLGLFLESGRLAHEPVLAVSPVWLRPSKQRSRGKGWVSPRSIDVSAMGQLLPVPKSGWEPEQEEALDQLLHGEVDRPWPSTQHSWTLISQPFQARALWALLDSATPPLLFYGKQTGPQLEYGVECRLTPSWQVDEEGVQHLQPSTTPSDMLSADAIIIRAGRELCYLDPAHGQFGRMHGDPRLMTLLRRAPSLPPEISDW